VRRAEYEAKIAELQAEVDLARREVRTGLPADQRVAILTIALMLEDKAATMPIRVGDDCKTERALRDRVEQMRASVVGANDRDHAAAADLYDDLAT